MGTFLWESRYQVYILVFFRRIDYIKDNRNSKLIFKLSINTINKEHLYSFDTTNEMWFSIYKLGIYIQISICLWLFV